MFYLGLSPWSVAVHLASEIGETLLERGSPPMCVCVLYARRLSLGIVRACVPYTVAVRHGTVWANMPCVT